jgi:hypothetical protein
VILLGIILIYFIVGVIVGRILFVKRMSGSIRYAIDHTYNEYNERSRNKRLVSTRDHQDAFHYGFWSLFFWWFTSALFIIQAPTPEERERKKVENFKELEKALNEAARELNLKTIDTR